MGHDAKESVMIAPSSRPCAVSIPRRAVLALAGRGATILALVAVAALAPRAPAAEPREFTFFMSSDPHAGFENKKPPAPVTVPEWADRLRDHARRLVATVGEPYPAIGPLRDLPPARVARPLAHLVAGDLTDKGDDPAQWPLFDKLVPAAGLDDGRGGGGGGGGRIPLFLGVGNHDGAPAGPTRLGAIARNRQAQKEGRLAAISGDGLHYAWAWQGVHFVCVNLCPADSTDADTPFNYGKPGPGTWNDPLGALTFLTGYLRTAVADTGAPVVVWQHYGYCEGFNFDWNWWSAKQRRAFYDAIRAYYVIALLHGHTHAAAHYRWPDAKANPREVARLFGDAPPPDLRSFEVFSGGSMNAGTFYVLRVTGDRLIAAARGPDGWSTDASLYSVSSIAPPR
jgi:hypothetical protein